MKNALATMSVVVLALSALVHAQESPASISKIPPCLVVARYGTDGPFFYRDQYGVPLDHLQLAYTVDELNYVMKNGGVKVVVYDVREHESFAEARESCFLTRSGPIKD
ncbi:MAG: hypothetical protein ACLPHP_12085 [Candidatus Sulfotelmatobacter sp.]